MKPMTCIAAAALVLCTLTACGKEIPIPEETQGELLLVEVKPTQAPTVPETQPESTAPDFSQKAEETKPSTEEMKPEAETRPETEEQKKETKPQAEKETEAAAVPMITKSPTREEIAAGEEAWFVAHADEAEGIHWWLSSPEGEEGQKPEEVKKLFPDLKIQGADGDTLILSHIPLEMNGWTVQAEFYNDTGSSMTDPAPLAVHAAPTGELSSAYGPVIESCKFIQRFDPNTDSPDLLAGNDPYALSEGLDLMGGGLGYALKDLDGNGVEELIIGVPGTNSFGSKGGDMIFALFTLRGNTPVKLAQSWARNRHYLASDGRIYNEGSANASSSSFTMLRLDGTGLKATASLWTEGTDQKGRMRAFYSPEGIPDGAHSKRVHDEEFYSLQADMIASRLPLPELTDILAYE